MTDKHTLVERLQQQLEIIQDYDRPLPWVVHSGSSYRRIASKPTRENPRSFPDGNVLHGIVDRHDGHHDLSMGEAQLVALVAIINAIPELCTRITALEAREAELVEANQRLRNGYADAVSGYRYILQNHGRLNGVGFDRVIDHFAQWVTIPEREGLVAGSHTLARATLAKHQEGEG